MQARKFGAVFMVPGEAQPLDRIDGHFVVGLADGAQIEAHAVVLATGVRFRRLDLPEAVRFEGSSIYYAATEFEARVCRGEPVVIVGGGNSAGQVALFLARTASDVHLVIRHDDLNRDMSRYLAERIISAPRVHVWRNNEVCELRDRRPGRRQDVRDLERGRLRGRRRPKWVGETSGVGRRRGRRRRPSRERAWANPQRAATSVTLTAPGTAATSSAWTHSSLRRRKYAIGVVSRERRKPSFLTITASLMG